MRLAKFFALSTAAIVGFDSAASLASKASGFSYSYASFGSIALYLGLSFVCARKFGFLKAVLLGAFLGLTDATVGWAVSWYIGPGRFESSATPVTIWLVTMATVVTLANWLEEASVRSFPVDWRPSRRA